MRQAKHTRASTGKTINKKQKSGHLAYVLQRAEHINLRGNFYHEQCNSYIGSP